MKIEFLGSYGGNTTTTNLTSIFVDDCLAIDAGSITQSMSLKEQYRVTDVIVSHSHLDHTLSLPFLVDNLFDATETPLKVWSSKIVIDALKSHVFNEVTWPDFTVLPSPEKPSIVFAPVEAEKTFRVKHFKVTPVSVNHLVPCFGYFVESTRSDSCVLYTADTTSTDRIWELANRRSNLKAIIVDCSFPNEMEELASQSGHNTPNLLARDLAKLKVECEILVYHIKPMFRGVMLKQLEELGHPRLRTEIQGKCFEF